MWIVVYVDGLPDLRQGQRRIRGGTRSVARQAAFRFLLIAIGAFALDRARHRGSRRALGVAGTFLGLSAAAVAGLPSPREAPAPAAAAARRAASRPEVEPAYPGGRERDGRGRGAPERDQHARVEPGRRTFVLVVCPALNSRCGRGPRTRIRAREAAQQRLDDEPRAPRVGRHRRARRGRATAIRCRRSRTRCGRSPRRDRDLDPSAGQVELARARRRRARVRARYDVPVTHVVVDLGQARARLRDATCRRRTTTKSATAWICSSSSWPLNGGIPPCRSSRGRPRGRATASPRRGSARRCPSVPASASVWQRTAGRSEDRLAVRRFSAVTPGAGDGADVLRDVRGQPDPGRRRRTPEPSTSSHEGRVWSRRHARRSRRGLGDRDTRSASRTTWVNVSDVIPASRAWANA